MRVGQGAAQRAVNVVDGSRLDSTRTVLIRRNEVVGDSLEQLRLIGGQMLIALSTRRGGRSLLGRRRDLGGGTNRLDGGLDTSGTSRRGGAYGAGVLQQLPARDHPWSLVSHLLLPPPAGQIPHRSEVATRSKDRDWIDR